MYVYLCTLSSSSFPFIYLFFFQKRRFQDVVKLLKLGQMTIVIRRLRGWTVQSLSENKAQRRSIY